MGGIKIQPSTEIQLKKAERSFRPSAWGRMLLTSALLLSLSGCATAEVKKPTVQLKEGAKIEQVVSNQESKGKKKEPKLVIASRSVEVEGKLRKLTVETRDDWNHFLTSWENSRITRERSMSVAIKEMGGYFINREINMGVNDCESIAIKGEAVTYGLLLAPIFGPSGGGLAYGTLVDTEVSTIETVIQIEQLKDSCDWVVKLFRNGHGPYTLRVSEKGQILEDSTKPISQTAMNK